MSRESASKVMIYHTRTSFPQPTKTIESSLLHIITAIINQSRTESIITIASALVVQIRHEDFFAVRPENPDIEVNGWR